MDVSRSQPIQKTISAVDIQLFNQVERGVWKAPDGKLYRIAYYPKGIAHSERRELTDDEVKEFLSILSSTHMQFPKLSGLTVSLQGVQIPDIELPEENRQLTPEAKESFRQFTLKMSHVVRSVGQEIASRVVEQPLQRREVTPLSTSKSQIPGLQEIVEGEDFSIELVEVPEEQKKPRDLLDLDWEIVSSGATEEFVVEEVKESKEGSIIEIEDIGELAEIIAAHEEDINAVPGLKEDIIQFQSSSIKIHNQNKKDLDQEIVKIKSVEIEEANRDSWEPPRDDELVKLGRKIQEAVSANSKLNGSKIKEAISYRIAESMNPILSETCRLVSRKWLQEQKFYNELDTMWWPRGLMARYVDYLANPHAESNRAVIAQQIEGLPQQQKTRLEAIIKKVEEPLVEVSIPAVEPITPAIDEEKGIKEKIRYQWSIYKFDNKLDLLPERLNLPKEIVEIYQEYIADPSNQDVNEKFLELINQLPEARKKFIETRKLVIDNAFKEIEVEVQGRANLM